MNPKLKMIIPAVILIVTLVVVILAYKKVLTTKSVNVKSPITTSRVEPKKTDTPDSQEEALPPVTGKIDDTVEAIVKESTNEGIDAAEELGEEMDEINADIQDINDLRDLSDSNEL